MPAGLHRCAAGSNPQPGNRRWLRPATLVAHFSSRAGPGLSWPGAACKASSSSRRFSWKAGKLFSSKKKINMTNQNYNIEEVAGGVPVKMWTKGVPVEDDAKRQLANAARLPIVFKHIAAMPDVHLGIGATVGSVIPTLKAIIPAAVGVDIGCGMMAAKTTLRAEDLPDNLVRCARPSSRPCRTARRRAAVATRAAGRTRPCPWTRSGPRWPTSSTRCASCIRACATPTTASTWARWARATTSSRSAWMRRVSSGSCCTRARAAWATPSARTSSSWPRRTRSATRATCRTRIWPISRKAPSISAIMCARCRGRRSSRCATAR